MRRVTYEQWFLECDRFMMVWFISTCIYKYNRLHVVSVLKFLNEKIASNLTSIAFMMADLHSKKGQTKLKLGFSTTKRKASENEDLSLPTEDQIQCDSCYNETPSASGVTICIWSRHLHLFLHLLLFFDHLHQRYHPWRATEGQMKVLLEKLKLMCIVIEWTLLPRNLKFQHFLHLFSGKACTLQPHSQQTT